MNRTTAKAAALLAALALSPAAARAGVLYDGFSTQGGGAGVDPLASSTLSDTGKAFATPAQPVGMAIAGGSLFMTYDHNLARYGLDGAAQASYNLGFTYNASLLAGNSDTLFLGYNTAGGAILVDFLNAATLNETGTYFYVPGALTGLAVSEDSVFVTYSHHLAQYDMNGKLVQDINTGALVDPGALAYGDGKLFMAFTRPQSGSTWVDYIDASTMTELGTYFSTSSLAQGLAYGDGKVFASFEHDLGSWDMAGKSVSTLNTGPYFSNGPIAYLSDAAAPGGVPGVPEPTTWAVMILGFWMIGANLRRRNQGAPPLGELSGASRA